ncbi:MAG: hypothetical protein HY787_23075 [Deltaproteobacteria bacterium]|nr:hypothetical protein [Deltaproteobacteria bacterium]
MARSTEKKEEKPRYETPVVVQLDKLDKASGADGCSNGSNADPCANGGVAVTACGAGTVGDDLG